MTGRKTNVPAIRRVIYLFLDGVGIGADDPAINPLVAANMPTLAALLDGQHPVLDVGRLSTGQAEFIPTDAQMGVAGRPQSATGQATIVTGINAPQRLGEHYGPRPDDRVRAVIDEGNLFRRLHALGTRPYFVNAYPEVYFRAVERGKRRLSAIPYAVTTAGQALLTQEALRAGNALADDFSGAGWRTELGCTETPLYTPAGAGRRLWAIAQEYQFVFFEHWLTDVLGHRGRLHEATVNFERFDQFLAGLLEVADLAHTLIIVGSDHGNVEDCSHGKHTTNPAFTLLVGDGRKTAAEQVHSLADYARVITAYLAPNSACEPTT